jgi:threonine/homoserine/homoserine lactone efflux protein
MAIDTFLLYLTAWTLVSVSPGPAVLFAMSQASRHGMRGATAGTGGILLAHLLCFTLVAFGLMALLASIQGAMTAIRLVGAAYLVYLGALMLMAKPRATPDVNAAAPRPAARAGIALQGMLVQLTNPKNLLFVLAFLPQFIDPERPLLLQLAIMLTVTVIVDGVVLLAYAQLAVRGTRALKGSRLVAWLERVFGAALILFGIRLAMTPK